jgi:hypothetical protein
MTRLTESVAFILFILATAIALVLCVTWGFDSMGACF